LHSASHAGYDRLFSCALRKRPRGFRRFVTGQGSPGNGVLKNPTLLTLPRNNSSAESCRRPRASAFGTWDCGIKWPLVAPPNFFLAPIFVDVDIFALRLGARRGRSHHHLTCAAQLAAKMLRISQPRSLGPRGLRSGPVGARVTSTWAAPDLSARGTASGAGSWVRGPILAPLLSCFSSGRPMLGEPDVR
jgi:hypothetical protein